VTKLLHRVCTLSHPVQPGDHAEPQAS